MLLLQTTTEPDNRHLVTAGATVCGAIIGAALKYLFDQLGAKKVQVLEETQKFSLPNVFGKTGKETENLHVSWRGQTYKSLTRSTHRIKNAGRADIPESEFIIEFPHGKDRWLTNVVETSSQSHPVAKTISSQMEKVPDLTRLRYTFKLPLLEKGDSVEINILYDGDDPVYKGVRGTGGAKIRTTNEWSVHPLVKLAFWGGLFFAMADALKKMQSPVNPWVELWVRVGFLSAMVTALVWIALDLSSISRTLSSLRRKR